MLKRENEFVLGETLVVGSFSWVQQHRTHVHMTFLHHGSTKLSVPIDRRLCGEGSKDRLLVVEGR